MPTLAGLSDVTPSLTLRTLDVALVIDVIDVMDSLDPVRLSEGVVVPLLCTTHWAAGLRLDGDLLTFANGANKLNFG